MAEQSLDDLVNKLQRRVEYLERELDLSYEEHRFVNRIEKIFPDEAEIEYDDGTFGHYAQVSDITGDDVQHALDTIDGLDLDLGTAVTETGTGVGMEVWTI